MFGQNMKVSFGIFLFVVCVGSLAAAFSWQSCGKKTDPAKIISLDIFSNHSKMLYVTGRGKLALNLTAPIQGTILVQKKFFWGWMTIPCVEQVGSCTYDDICSLSPYNNTCPDEFLRNQLPCRCPFLEGQYAAKRFSIDLSTLPLWLEEGRYRIRLKLTKDDQELFCVVLNITI